MGQADKVGWLIACRGIAVTMGETDIEKSPANHFPGERLAQGWATLDKHLKQICETLLEGGLAKMQSKIGPKTE